MKNLLSERKLKINRLLAWVFGISTLVAIIIFIAVGQEYWWERLIYMSFIFVLAMVWLAFLSRYITTKKSLQIKEYLNNVEVRTIFDDAVEMSINGELQNSVSLTPFG